MVREDTLNDFNLLKFNWGLFYGLICGLWIFHMYLRKMCFSAIVGWNVLYISVRLSWYSVNFSVSLLIFCLAVVSIIENGVLMPPLIIVELFLPLILSVFPPDCWVHIYLNCYIFLMNWLFYYSVRSFFVHCNDFCLEVCFAWYQYSQSICLWLLFVWNTCFCPFTFSLFVYLDLKWVSSREHIVGSCFVSHSVHLCL